MSASISQLQDDLQPWARALVQAAGDAGLMPQITSTRRSITEQKRLYARYLAGQQPYPVARPGTSAHEFGWAFDMVVAPLSALPDVGALWEDWGGVWGGHPTRRGSGYDPVHFEWPDWRELVSASDLDSGGTGFLDAAHNLQKYSQYANVVGSPGSLLLDLAPAAVKDVGSFLPGPTGVYYTVTGLAQQAQELIEGLFK